MTENIESIRPHAVAVGGIFSAVLKAVKQPILGIALLPLAILFPNLASNLYYLEFSKQNSGNKKSLGEIFSFKTFLCIQVLYCAVLYALYSLISVKAEQYLKEYTDKALTNPVLQIATPEQSEYARHMSYLFGISAAVFFVLVIVMATLSHINALNCKEIPNIKCSIKLTLFAILKNLHVYILIFILLYVLVMIIENSFAHYKLMYLEAVILKKDDAFNPVYVFLIARIYVLYILYYVLNLLTLKSVGGNDRKGLQNAGN